METESEYNCITDVQPLTVAPVYPKAIYRPLNIAVEIVDFDENDLGERNYKVQTLDGSYPFTWSSWVGGNGYTQKHSDWIWCKRSDFDLISTAKPRCEHTTIEVIEVSDEDHPTGFSNGDVTYSSGTHLVGRCMVCGEQFDSIPEFEECKRIATERNISLLQVYKLLEAELL